MSKRNIKDHWNSTSVEYQTNFKVSTNVIQWSVYGPYESEINLIGDVKGKEIIELGCGGAQSSIFFAKRGAICTGVDMSVEQLKYAEALIKDNGVEIKLIEGDIEDLYMINDNSFEIAFSIYAFDWMQNIKQAFSEAYRILKKSGIFVFTMQHPFFNVLGDWNTELKVEKNYFERKDVCKESSGITIKYHNPTFGDLINGLIDVGFSLVQILEPESQESRINSDLEEQPLQYSEALRLIPSSVVIKARKL